MRVSCNFEDLLLIIYFFDSLLQPIQQQIAIIFNIDVIKRKIHIDYILFMKFLENKSQTGYVKSELFFLKRKSIFKKML